MTKLETKLENTKNEQADGYIAGITIDEYRELLARIKELETRVTQLEKT